jgi:hypothetical protein
VEEERTVLLDVLYADNPYAKVVEKEIKNSMLLTQGTAVNVTLPDISSILGDKLTAFAPHTTGVPLNARKDMEIIKQFFDISKLIDAEWNQDIVKESYLRVLSEELSYRDLELSYKDVLDDTIQTAMCIASRGKIKQEEYRAYLKGIRDVSGYAYGNDFNAETATIDAAKILYFAACLQTDQQFEIVREVEDFLFEKTESENLKPLTFLRKSKPTAYAYIIKADRVLR